MAQPSRAGAILRDLAKRAKALMANDAGLLTALIMLFIVSALTGLWVGVSLSAW